VKRITRGGKSVQVNDKGVPLWIIHPARGTHAECAARQRAIDGILGDLLNGKPSKLSLSKIVLRSRR
jgi:hypothetical protein